MDTVVLRNHKEVIRLCDDPKKLVSYLQTKGLLADAKDCPSCKSSMKLYCRKGRRREKCTKQVALRAGSWFSQSKLKMSQIVELTYWLTRSSLTIKDISHECDIAAGTVSQWAFFVGEALLEWMRVNAEPIGGPGKIVEIDESKFGRRKYHRGHRVEGQWVFGGIERGSGKCFLIPVERRDEETLIALIEKWIVKGTTILSDCWKAYNAISSKGYQHLTVNHSLHFKDPVTGTHTNTIEGLWRHVDVFLPQYSRRKNRFLMHMAHFMFLQKARECRSSPLDLFWSVVSDLQYLTPEDPRYQEPEEIDDIEL